MTEKKDGNKRMLTVRQEKFTADGSADSTSHSLTLTSVIGLVINFSNTAFFLDFAAQPRSVNTLNEWQQKTIVCAVRAKLDSNEFHS